MRKKSQSTIIKGEAGDLEIRLTRADSDKWLVVAHPHPQFGGTMDNKVVTTVEKAFQSLGYNTVAFQFRGVGQSHGEYDGGEGEQRDLAHVVAYIKELYSVHYIVLAGFSFGSYVAIRQAETLNADSLLVIAPPVNLYDFSQLQIENLPWVLVQGGEDEVVPAQEVLAWVRAQQNQPDIYWRAGASHFFHRQLVWLKKVIQLTY